MDPSPQTAPGQAATGGRPHVLVAEDEPHLARLLETLLDEREIRVTVAGTGGEALERLRADPAVSLVLLDLMMPGTDGLAVLEALRGDPATADLPVLVLTGRGEDELRERARELGVEGYYTKPFSPRRLLERVRELCRT